MAHSTGRCPMRSPAMPNIGAARVPKYCSDANRVRSRTEPVSVRMYQPRIRFSISEPQDVSRSAGYWKRKLRIWNGANSDERSTLCRLLCLPEEVLRGIRIEQRIHVE